MNPNAQTIDKSERAQKTVLIIGGSGGLSSRYRDIVEERGFSLRHYENRVPPGARRTAGKIALIIVIVTMVSHSLRQEVQSMALSGARVLYLKSASVSALRGAVEQCAA